MSSAVNLDSLAICSLNRIAYCEIKQVEMGKFNFYAEELERLI